MAARLLARVSSLGPDSALRPPRGCGPRCSSLKLRSWSTGRPGPRSSFGGFPGRPDVGSRATGAAVAGLRQGSSTLIVKVNSRADDAEARRLGHGDAAVGLRLRRRRSCSRCTGASRPSDVQRLSGTSCTWPSLTMTTPAICWREVLDECAWRTAENRRVPLLVGDRGSRRRRLAAPGPRCWPSCAAIASVTGAPPRRRV